MNIWMKVTSDEFALPLAVADSSSELARMCGTTANAVVSTWSHHRQGRVKYPSYICVKVGEEHE